MIPILTFTSLVVALLQPASPTVVTTLQPSQPTVVAELKLPVLEGIPLEQPVVQGIPLEPAHPTVVKTWTFNK